MAEGMKFVSDVPDVETTGEVTAWDGTEDVILEERTFTAGGTIVAGDAVALDIGTTVDCNQVVVCDSGGSPAGSGSAAAFVGIALNGGTAAARTKIRVVKKGIVTTCHVNGGTIAKGDLLFTQTTDPGALDDLNTAGTLVGVALAAATGDETIAAYINSPF